MKCPYSYLERSDSKVHENEVFLFRNKFKVDNNDKVFLFWNKKNNINIEK
jgi:hypothetical protein